MRGSMAALLLALTLPVIAAWTDRWDHSKRFHAAGHGELDCDGRTEPVSCCRLTRDSILRCVVCKSIVFEIETQLNNTVDDHDMDVVFRISEEKKKIRYSRSEARILEVLDNVCHQVPLQLPTESKKNKKILAAACDSFVGVYEDELTRAFFDDFTPAKDRMCVDTLQVCEVATEDTNEREEL